MQRDEQQRIDEVMERWSSGISNNPTLQHSNTPMTLGRRIQPRPRLRAAFALYEVLLGVAIFAIGVVALGRSVENCLSASTISAEESAVRQILSDRMAVVQASPGVPDEEKVFNINSNYGMVKLTQKNAQANLTEEDNTILSGIYVVTLTAQWQHAGVPQSKRIQFYVFRSE
jgi:Tfp pilus assembly protein PilV